MRRWRIGTNASDAVHHAAAALMPGSHAVSSPYRGTENAEEDDAFADSLAGSRTPSYLLIHGANLLGRDDPPSCQLQRGHHSARGPSKLVQGA